MQRACLRRHGRGDFADFTDGLDLGVVQQRDFNRLVGGRVNKKRFVNVEHGIAFTVTGQAEDRCRRLHDLADFGLPRGNDARRIGDQGGVTQLLAGIGQLRLGGFERALATVQLRLCRVVLTAAGVALGQELFLTHESSGGLPHAGLLGGDGSDGRVDVGLQVFGVELGQHLFGRHPITDIHRPLNDLAAHAERKLRLHPRLNIAGQRYVCGEIGRLDLLRLHACAHRFLGLFLLTASKNGQAQTEAEDGHTTMKKEGLGGHASSLCQCRCDTAPPDAVAM